MAQEKAILLKKGEVVSLLGYGTTNGYRYVNYLVEQGFLTPKYLPGVAKPKFLRTEVEELLHDTKPEGIPAFEPTERLNGIKDN
jgi:hypothetical protein